MNNEGKSPIEKFDGSDFGFRKMEIEDYLYDKDLYLIIGDKPSVMGDAEWKVLDRKAMCVGCLSLSSNVVIHNIHEGDFEDSGGHVREAIRGEQGPPNAAYVQFEDAREFYGGRASEQVQFDNNPIEFCQYRF